MTDTPSADADTSESTINKEEIKDMDIKKSRKEYPSGFMKLFREPSMRFVIDALLDRAPQSDFTKTELANQAGISTETLRKLFPTLKELGIIASIPGTNRYHFQEIAPVSTVLIQLGGQVNSMALEENQDALEHIDKFPDRRLSYYCEECGKRGNYQGRVLTGHVLECPEECMAWTVAGNTPPGAAIRTETMLTDDAELERLNNKANTDGVDTLTPHEQELIKCAFDDDTPPPLFAREKSDTSSESPNS